MRFVFLYQVIEMMMEVQREEKFIHYLQLYQSKSIHSNDFREKMNESSKERKIIGNVFSVCIKNLSDYFDFHQECNDFLLDSNGQVSELLSNSVYNLRNLLIHNFRFVANKMEALDKIVVGLEQLILDMLLDYKHGETNTIGHEI